MKHPESVKSSSESNLFDKISHPKSALTPPVYDPLLNSSSYSACSSRYDACILQVEQGCFYTLACPLPPFYSHWSITEIMEWLTV